MKALLITRRLPDRLLDAARFAVTLRDAAGLPGATE